MYLLFIKQHWNVIIEMLWLESNIIVTYESLRKKQRSLSLKNYEIRRFVFRIWMPLIV